MKRNYERKMKLKEYEKIYFLWLFRSKNAYKIWDHTLYFNIHQNVFNKEENNTFFSYWEMKFSVYFSSNYCFLQPFFQQKQTHSLYYTS